MKLMVAARLSATLFLLGSGLAFGQLSTPPATRTAARTPIPVNTAPPAGHPARVVYLRGLIEVDADNSNLNQIFQEIARVTGMKITGSLAQGSVFGKYGPAEPARILETLLDGTGINMLLKETASGAPAELILTPRNGSATPPNPAAAQDVAEEVLPATVPTAPDGGPAPVGGVVIRDINGNPAPPGSPVPAAAPPAETSEQMQQRIQLLQMQQQQQQQYQQRPQAGQH